jgi:hypothetical protein
MNTLQLTKKSINRSPCRRGLILITLALGYFALSLPKSFGVVPAPDGGYPGGNTAEGQTALLSLTTGGFNTAVGYLSLRSNTTGSLNTAVGAGTLLVNTADSTTAIGAGALLSNTTGVLNTANGAFALFNNTTGAANTANGYQALFSNTTGDHNTATGVAALGNNTTGPLNTANGAGALLSNTTGDHNTANGANALFSNTDGAGNTANGSSALYSNTGGGNNTCIGKDALFHNTIGAGNTAIGVGVLGNNTTGVTNTGIGEDVLVNNTTGHSNTALGAGAGSAITTANNVICIATAGADVDNSCFIGNIFGAPVAIGAVQVMVDSNGQLGTQMSSRRFKKEIKPMGQASEAVLALRPVTFHYKSDPAGAGPQFGLIAEEVAEVNPDLVVRDKDGQIYTVRYEAVNAMLLNEFLKEHRKVEEQAREVRDQQATIAQLKLTVAQQWKDFQATAEREQKQISALGAGLEKVNAQIEGASSPQDESAVAEPRRRWFSIVGKTIPAPIAGNEFSRLEVREARTMKGN